MAHSSRSATRSRIAAASRTCAFSNSAPRRCGAAALLFGLGLAACSGATGPAPGEDAAAVRARVARLIDAATPIEATFTSDILDYHFLQWQTLLGRLKRDAPPAVGVEALRVLREQGHEAVQVETSLLFVAAHTAPETTGPYLEQLVTEYGHALHLRTEAVMLLADTHPARAIEIFRPILTGGRHFKTYPDMEFFVRAWADAHEHLGSDPTDVLVDVATNMFMQDAARHFAVKELAKRPSRLAAQALEAVLLESTGNGVLRRYAAQGLAKVLAPEEACALLSRVATNEAELNMQIFLVNLLSTVCGRVSPPTADTGKEIPSAAEARAGDN